MRNAVNKSYQTLFLKAGDICMVSLRISVWTILGSCVSVVLRSRRNQLMGICHGQLPDQRVAKCTCSNSCPRPCGIVPTPSDDLYVSNSIRHMLDLFQGNSIPFTDLDARIYGGAAILHPEKPFEDSIGYQNIATAKKILSAYPIPIIEEITGGNQGRSIYLYTDTGEIVVKTHTTN